MPLTAFAPCQSTESLRSPCHIHCHTLNLRIYNKPCRKKRHCYAKYDLFPSLHGKSIGEASIYNYNQLSLNPLSSKIQIQILQWSAYISLKNWLREFCLQRWIQSYSVLKIMTLVGEGEVPSGAGIKINTIDSCKLNAYCVSMYIRFVSFCWCYKRISAQVQVTARVTREANNLLG